MKTRLWLDSTLFLDSQDLVATSFLTEATTTVGTATLTLWSLAMRARVALHRWTIDVDFPMSHMSLKTEFDSPSDGQSENLSRFALGNLTVGASHHWVSGNLHASVGGALAAPTATVPTDAPLLTLTALGGGAQTRGLHHLWWFLPETLSLVVPWSVRHRASLDVGVDGAGALATGAGTQSPDTGAIFDLGGHIGYASDYLETGARLRVVVYSEFDDAAQVSMEPYVVGYPGPVMVGGGLVVNLDEPSGPLFDDGSIWGLHFVVGGQF